MRPHHFIDGTLMKSNLQKSFIPMQAILGAITLTVCGASHAAQDGFYLGANANVSIGPSVVTVSNAAFPSGTTYTGGGNTNAFGLSSDGRFQYDAALGYIKNNFGLELRYISLGSQKQITQNGQSMGANESGSYSGKYYGINGKYFVPLNQGKQDLHFTLGGGKLVNDFSALNSNATNPASNLTASQNEFALMLGAGMRFNVTKIVGLNLEVNRITPVTHGLFNSGIYNNAYTVISAGFVVSY